MTLPRVALAVLLCVVEADGAAALHRTVQRGPATLDVRADGPADGIAITDRLTVTITLDAGPGLEVEVLPNPAPSPAWLLVEQRPPTTESLTTGGRRWRQMSLLAPLLPGPQSWQPPPLRYRDHAAADWQELAWPPIEITVAAVPQGAEGEGLRDITSIETLPPEPDRSAPPWVWGVAVVLVAVILIGFYRRARAPRSGVQEPARMALIHLQRLTARRLPERGHAERFVTVLTLILRRYLEKQHHLTARRQTTADLLHSIAGHESLSPAQRQFLESFLPRCDLIKFAGAAASVAECGTLAEEVRRFITETGQSRTLSPK